MNYTDADFAALAAGPVSTSLWVWALAAVAVAIVLVASWAWYKRRGAAYLWIIGGLFGVPAVVGYVAGAWPRAYPALISALVQVAVLGLVIWAYKAFRR